MWDRGKTMPPPPPPPPRSAAAAAAPSLALALLAASILLLLLPSHVRPLSPNARRPSRAGRSRFAAPSAARRFGLAASGGPSPPPPSSSSSSASSSSSSSSVPSPEATVADALTPHQLDFTVGYLNKHHRDLLRDLALSFTEIGETKSRRNAFSGGSYRIEDAEVVDLDVGGLVLDVTVRDRRDGGPKVERATVALDSDPTPAVKTEYRTLPPVPPPSPGSLPIDVLVRRLNRLCLIVRRPSVTGKLIRLAIQIGGAGVGKLRDNLYLNQVPHNRYVRGYFYDMAAEAALEAVILCGEGKIGNRMKMVAMFPEMNPSMDSYRIGTLLELVRSIGIKLAEQNLRVRICVQSSMGVGIFTGVPKQLNGVSTLLRRMDWQSGEGEENDGMVGEYVNFGAVGAEHVVNAHTDEDGRRVEQDDVFVVICPQSMVGLECSIIGPLSEMVDAAGDRPVILINPDLNDKVSSQGQQSVRGRKERMEFADSFGAVFHFANIYVSGTSYFPILGSILKGRPTFPWVAHQRRDMAGEDGGEVYVPILSTEEQPTGEMIMGVFER